MDPGDNPYDILGVDRNATSSQIKAAYRKAALRHHPDKQNTDEDRRKATQVFAKISNAYEILSDPEQKREYDGSRSSQRRHNSGRGVDPFEDSFFSSHRHHFHDPFRVFEEVFREEFGRSRGSPSSSSNHHHQRATYRSPFDDDPFFARHGGMMDPFRPFFGGGFFDRGGMFSDPFEEMRRMQEDMHRQMGMFDEQQQQQQSQSQQQGSSSSGPQRSVFYSSSSTSRIGGNGRDSVTTTTTTRMINGKKQIVTERVIEKADGTVEREFEKSGDEDFPAHLLENDNDQTTQRQSNRYLPESENNNNNNNLPRRHSSKRHHSPHRRDSRHHQSSRATTEEKPKRGSGWFW